MKKPKPAAPLSHAEFETLPNAVQRKYFSSLERLRLEEEHSLQQHKTHPDFHHRRRPTAVFDTPLSSRPPSSSQLARSLTLGSARRRLRKPESLRQEHDISQAEARFFLSLPAKVRKRHFSQEEQVLLAGRCDNFLHLDGQSPTPERRQLDGFQFDFFDDSDSTPSRDRSRRRSSSVSPTRDRPAEEVEKDDGLIYLDKMTPPLSQQALPPTNFRRTLSLTSMSFRHSTSSAPPIVSPLFSHAPQPWRPRASSQTQSGRRSSHTPVAPVFDPEAAYYQDPEARKKLRMYLSSAQKFDEAVEFGFPSLAGKTETTAPRYQLPPITTDAHNFSKDMQTFLKDDKMSFLEETDADEITPDSDGESVTDVDSPVTPSSTGVSFRYRPTRSNFSSLDSTGLPPVHGINSRGPLNREMTLRMTLTRPDLRADEDQPYGWQALKGGKDDPFALEELHLSDDMTGAKGAFTVKPKPHGNLVSRLFRRASRKGHR